MELLEGRVVIVTGGGRGLGRQHCLELARHGAAVVVNDLGSGLHGEAEAATPAQEVVAEIAGAGGTASADDTSVTDFDGVAALVENVVAELRPARCRRQQRGNHPRSHDHGDVGGRLRPRGCRTPQGHVEPHASRLCVLAGRNQSGTGGRRPDRQHDVGRGVVRQHRPVELRARQGGDRQSHLDHRDGDGSLRGHCECGLTAGPNRE